LEYFLITPNRNETLDNVGAKINIFKSTDICVDIIVSGIREDKKTGEGQNKLSINSKVGNVKIYWEANKPLPVPTNLEVRNVEWRCGRVAVRSQFSYS